MKNHRISIRQLGSALVLFFTLAVCPRMQSQEETGQMLGTVHDPSGAVVANAQVTAKNRATGIQTHTKTNTEGGYLFPALSIGQYDVTVTAPGFARSITEGVRIISAVSTKADIALSVGGTSDTVNVSATTDQVDPTATAPGTTRTVEEINQLPLILNSTQRSSVSFARTFAGVSWTPGQLDDGSQGINVASINGAPEGGASYRVDGIIASVGGHGQVRDDFSPPPEMIQEMSVISNTASEFAGWNSGVGVALVTKSGTNSVHGSVYEYLRNDALDAKNYFAKKPTPNKQNEFGFAIGGPIRKDKTFFFGLYSGYRLRTTPAGVSATVPTAGMRAGDFSALLGPQIGVDALGRPIFQGEIYDPATTRPDGKGGFIRDPFNFGGQLNHIDPARFSAVSKFFQQGYPDPTQPGTSLNWVGEDASSPVDSNKFNIKIDHSLTNNQKISVGYDHWWRTEIFGSTFAPVISGTWALTDNTWRTRINYTWTIKPNLLLDFRAAFNRAQDKLAPSGPNATGGQQAGIKGVLDPSTPPVSIQDATGFGAPFGGTIFEPAWMVPAGVDLSWTKGRHSLKFGADYVSNNFVLRVDSPSSGIFNFTRLETGLPGAPAGTGWGYASFLVGEVDSSTLSTPVNLKFQAAAWGFYAQDQWRVTPKLTLSYGLRWDIYIPLHEGQDRISAFDPIIPNPAAGNHLGALTFWGNGPGRNGRHNLGDIYWREFSPRLGFAYSITPKTVVRGSYGLSSPAFYGAFGGGTWVQPPNGWVAEVTPASLDNGVTPAFNWDNGFPNIIPSLPNLDPSLINGSYARYIDPHNLRPSRTENVTVGVQREVPAGIVATVNYIGNFTHGLIEPTLVQLNQLNPKFLALGNLLLQPINSPAAIAAGIQLPYPGFVGSVAQALRPYPQYQNIDELTAPVGYTKYNALQVTAQKHTGSGLSFLVAYTFSKNLTNHGTASGQGQSFTPVVQFTEQRAGYSRLADLDRTHMLQVSSVYELPFGRGKRFANVSSGALDKLVGGWALALLANYMSGTPITLSTSQNVPGGYSAGAFGDSAGVFPNILPGISQQVVGCSQYSPKNGTPYLNSAAFADPAPFSLGDTRVLSKVRTCGYKNENVSVIKNFGITERVRFAFAMDFNNIFNRHYWAGLTTNIDSPAFGQYGTATDPREIMAHVKVSF